MDKSRQQFDRYFSDKHDLTMKHFGDPVIKFTMDRLLKCGKHHARVWRLNCLANTMWMMSMII